MAGDTKRHCFSPEDDALASFADVDLGYSHFHYQQQHAFVSRTLGYGTFYHRGLRTHSIFSPKSARFQDHNHKPHFLDSCFRCKKPLGGNRDIFMYRGDTPFCSEECRQEQIERDEAKEKNKNLSSSMKALRKKEQRKSVSPNKTQNYSFHTGTVAAA